MKKLKEEKTRIMELTKKKINVHPPEDDLKMSFQTLFISLITTPKQTFVPLIHNIISTL